MKVQTVGSRAQVMHGTAKKTSGGLKKGDLKRNSGGDIVSVKKSDKAKRTENPTLKLWRSSVKKAYEMPKYKGKFVLIKKGSPFYNDVKKIFMAKVGKKSTKKKSTRKTRKPCKPCKK